MSEPTEHTPLTPKTVYQQLASRLESAVSALYQRILSDQLFLSLSKSEQSRDYIVLRIEEIVRDTVGRQRCLAIDDILNENKTLLEQLSKHKHLSRQSKDQSQQQRELNQVLLLENDRLKFEVVQVGEEAARELERMGEEMRELREAFGESARRLEEVQSECIREVASREEEMRRLRARGGINGSNGEKNDSKEGSQCVEEEAESQHNESQYLTGQHLQTQQLSRNNSNFYQPSPKSEPKTSKHSQPAFASKESRSQSSNLQLSKLHQQLSDTTKMLSIVTTEFEQYKQDVLDNHKKEREEFREFLEKTEKERREGEKEKEREEGLLKEIEELRQTILGGEKVRQAILKDKQNVENSYSEVKDILEQQSQRVKSMEEEIAEVKAVRRRLEAEIQEWKGRLQKSQQSHQIELQQLQSQLLQQKLSQQTTTTHQLQQKCSQIQFLKTLTQDLKTQLIQQKQTNCKKITQIQRLNLTLKSMYQKKIDLLQLTSSQTHQKSQKYKSQTKLLKEQLVEVRTMYGKLQKQVASLEEKLVQLTKMNSQLEREARAARTDCRNLERVVKEGREKLEAVEAGRRGDREKMGRVRGRVKELLGRFGKLQEYFEETRFKALQYRTMCKLVIQQHIKLSGKQLMSSLYQSSKDLLEQTRSLTTQNHSLSQHVQKLQLQTQSIRQQKQQTQQRYNQMLMDLEDKLAEQEGKENDAMGHLEKEIMDLRGLCARLQEVNLEVVREVEVLRRREERREDRREEKDRDRERGASKGSRFATKGNYQRDRFIGGVVDNRAQTNQYDRETAYSEYTVKDPKLTDMQRYYDKIISSLEQQNVKLRCQTHRAQLRFEQQIARLDSLHKSKEKISSQTELISDRSKSSISKSKPSITRPEHQLIKPIKLDKTREKASPVPSFKTELKQHNLRATEPTFRSNDLLSDIKREIEQQRLKIQQNRRAFA